MSEIDLLKEQVLRLEREINLIKRARNGLSVEPALNTLGQDTKINGNLDVAGDLDITGAYLENGSPLTADDPNAVHLDGSRTMTGDLKNSSTQIIAGYGSNGETAVQGGSNGAIEIGKAGRSVAGTPFIDFHSSQNSPDYDSRIIASGGSSAGSQQGTLNLLGGSILKNNATILSLGAGEIANTTEKTSVATGDLFLIEDSAASNAKKRITRSTLQTNLSIAGSQVTGWLETTTGIGIRVYRTTDQAMANNAWTAVSLEQISWESKNPTMATQWTSGAANNLYCKKAGVYMFTAGILWNTNSTGNRGIAVFKNGTGIAQHMQPANATVAPALTISIIWYMEVQDYFHFAGYQSSGASLNCSATGGYTFASMAKLG